MAGGREPVPRPARRHRVVAPRGLSYDAAWLVSTMRRMPSCHDTVEWNPRSLRRVTSSGSDGMALRVGLHHRVLAHEVADQRAPVFDGHVLVAAPVHDRRRHRRRREQVGERADDVDEVQRRVERRCVGVHADRDVALDHHHLERLPSEGVAVGDAEARDHRRHVEPGRGVLHERLRRDLADRVRLVPGGAVAVAERRDSASGVCPCDSYTPAVEHWKNASIPTHRSMRSATPSTLAAKSASQSLLRATAKFKHVVEVVGHFVEVGLAEVDAHRGGTRGLELLPRLRVR